MRTRNDLSRSFCSPGATNTYHCALVPNSEMKREIQAAERLVRIRLSEDLPTQLKRHLPENAAVAKPKFRKQGSWAYGVLNDPLRSSDNYAEADSDLGTYLSISTLKNCTDKPEFGAEIYLGIVEASLKSLASEHPGWTVKRKSCCVRLKMRPDAHIDVTCYVVPEETFTVMAKAEFAEARKTVDGLEADLTWEDLPDRPLLATNENGWQPSDAKAIHEYIENAAAMHGPGFKRNICYVKGARDFGDDKRGPASIAITVILAKHMDSRALVREDLGVLAALGIVADRILEFVPTPGNEQIDILKNLDPSDRQQLSDELKRSQQRVNDAIFHQPWDGAHAILREVFGQRFPAAADAPAQNVDDFPETPHIQTSKTARVAALAPAGNVRSA